MSRFNILCLMALIALAGSSAQAAILLDDNFDSYANQAAFQAAWTPSTTSGGGTLTTTPVFSAPNSVLLPTSAGFRNSRSFTDTTPTVTDDVQLSFRILVPSLTLGRHYVDLVDAAGSGSGQLLELGINNGIASNEWSVRMLGSVEANAFTTMDAAAPNRVANQWAEIKAVIHRETATTASAKVFVDGVLGKTLTGFTLRGYDSVRIGSNLSSAITVSFDDVRVETVAVPEPASIGLIALAALGLSRRCRAA